MPIDDREQQFDRALARHLREALGGPCPDAEILAAYHERTLSLEEMAKWKEHIAACERCQEALALVEQTETVDSEEWQEKGEVVTEQQAIPLKSLARVVATRAAQREEKALAAGHEAAIAAPGAIRRSRANWKWIVPIGALAAGVIAWVGTVEVQKRNQRTAETVQIAENRRAAEAPPTSQPKELRTDALEQKQADSEKAQRDEGVGGAATSKMSAGAAETRPAQSSIAPQATPQVRGQLDKKKDSTGEGFGNGIGAPAPAAPPVALRERGKNEITAEEKQATGAAGAINGLVAGAKPAPAAAPEKGRSSMAYKTAPAVVAGDLATITGTVLDPSGAAIGGAVVTAIDTSSGNAKTAVADATGKFQLSDLPSDQYRVIVAHAGFAKSEQIVALQPKENEQLRVQLNVGSMSETVEVSAAASTVNTESAAVSKDANKPIANLPLQVRNFDALMQLAAGSQQYIVTPDKHVGWRVGDGGKIERTTDSGRTWKTQTSGVSANLRTGSATSGKVCWIVGKAGTILLTTDGGKHWKQIASPIPDDLGGIHAVDAQHASVWDVANRKSYETSDGGVTWEPTANE